jgi:hypothetical protein
MFSFTLRLVLTRGKTLNIHGMRELVAPRNQFRIFSLSGIFHFYEKKRLVQIYTFLTQDTVAILVISHRIAAAED